MMLGTKRKIRQVGGIRESLGNPFFKIRSVLGKKASIIWNKE